MPCALHISSLLGAADFLPLQLPPHLLKTLSSGSTGQKIHALAIFLGRRTRSQLLWLRLYQAKFDSVLTPLFYFPIRHLNNFSNSKPVIDYNHISDNVSLRTLRQAVTPENKLAFKEAVTQFHYWHNTARRTIDQYDELLKLLDKHQGVDEEGDAEIRRAMGILRFDREFAAGNVEQSKMHADLQVNGMGVLMGLIFQCNQLEMSCLDALRDSIEVRPGRMGVVEIYARITRQRMAVRWF